MGFNNGYDSGYDDAKAEMRPKIKALEERIAELEAGGGSASGGRPAISLAGRNVKEIVYDNADPQYPSLATTVNAEPDAGEPSIFVLESGVEEDDVLLLAGTPPDVMDQLYDTEASASLGFPGDGRTQGVFVVDIAHTMRFVAPLSAIIA